MYTHRSLTDKLELLARTFPVVVVSGARQVGKTTLLQHVFGTEADLVVFDPVQDIGNARRDPDLFLDNHPAPVILDEIQYVPELVAAIKRRVDRERGPGKFLLTGSQQWHVLRSLAESLAGRAVFLDLEGFSLGEVAGAEVSAAWLPAWMDDPEAFQRQRRDRLALPFGPFREECLIYIGCYQASLSDKALRLRTRFTLGHDQPPCCAKKVLDGCVL